MNLRETFLGASDIAGAGTQFQGGLAHTAFNNVAPGLDISTEPSVDVSIDLSGPGGLG